MKIYWVLLLSLAYFSSLFGFVLPMLFSERNNESVVLGVVLLGVAIPLGGAMFFRTAKKVIMKNMLDERKKRADKKQKEDENK